MGKRYKCESTICGRTARRNKDHLPPPNCPCGSGPMIEASEAAAQEEAVRPKGRRPWPKLDTRRYQDTKGDALRAVEFWLDQGAGVVGAWHPDDMVAGEHDAEIIKGLVLDQLRKVPADKLKQVAARLRREY